MTQTLTLGLVQMRCSADSDQNLGRAAERIREAAGRGARIICLPELFRSHYFCQTEQAGNFDLAETIPGPSTDVLIPLARDTGTVIIASLFERRASGLYHNTAVVIHPECGLSGCYRKMHIPHDPYYQEKYYFSPGDLGFRVFDLQPGKISVLICWDQWFPEAARLATLAGAQLVFYPTAIGWIEDESHHLHRAQHDAWETVQRGHAVANGVFVAAVNRVGREGALTFWGQSFVCDPFGRVLARASDDREETLVARCDLGLIEETRRQWPFLRDRRVDSYQGIGRVFGDQCDRHE